jgi:hypothetical protein
MNKNKTELIYIIPEHKAYAETIKSYYYSIECANGFERRRIRRLLHKYLEYISYKEGLI